MLADGQRKALAEGAEESAEESAPRGEEENSRGRVSELGLLRQAVSPLAICLSDYPDKIVRYMTKLPLAKDVSTAVAPSSPPLALEISRSDYLRRIFSKEGLLSQRFKGYEPRRGQVRMAQAVDAAFRDKQHLIVEAPCGTGKSLAYLAPALHHAKDGPVVVCTANIALQEQLFAKDLPLLESVLGHPISFALLKGKNNYLCQDRFDEWCANGAPKGGRDYKAIIKWARKTQDGDVNQLGRALNATPSNAYWQEINGSPGECKSCKKNACWSHRARKRARRASVIICNYHVLFAHLQLKAETGQDILLPPLSHVIFDEGHEVADIAREFSKVQVSREQVVQIGNKQLENVAPDVHAYLLEETWQFFDAVLDYEQSRHYNKIIRKPNFVPGEGLVAALRATQDVWAKLFEEAKRIDADEGEIKTLNRRLSRVTNALSSLVRVLEFSAPNFVFWIETVKRDKVSLHGKLIEVGTWLKEALFDQVNSVVVTSATLTTHGNFRFIQKELGSSSKELIVESPFDFSKQARLIVPRMRFEPTHREFVKSLSGAMRAVITRSGGRTLALFTSYKNLRAAREELDDLPFRILTQGDMPRTQLVEEFLADTSSVLFGTKSFWAGVDVTGESLSCLIIDKLPFPSPNDPLVAAFERDPRKNVFVDYSLPRCVMALRQGFGRLIRSRTDRGIVVICDTRIASKRYGAGMLRSLPAAPVGRDTRIIEAFLASAMAPD